MSRIAFGSCCRYQMDPEQKVWPFIQSQAPDYLLMLGDQMYMDFGLPLFGGNLYEPVGMEFKKFVATMYSRYCTQFMLPPFNSMVQSIPKGRIRCVWDDHDFAWNNAIGGNGDHKHQVPDDKRRASRLLFEQFRTALASKEKDYPPAPDWTSDSETLPDLGGVQDSFVVDGIRVIMLDLRTWADLPGETSELLGEPGGPQDRWLQAELAKPEQEVIICSSLTLTKGTSWDDYPVAYERLLKMLGSKKVLFLTGDIHVNRLKTHRNPFGALPIHEATSSGLAITGYKFSYNGPLSNSGLLEISPSRIEVYLYRDIGKPDGNLVIDRASWR